MPTQQAPFGTFLRQVFLLLRLHRQYFNHVQVEHKLNNLRTNILMGNLPRHQECFTIALKWLIRKYKHVPQEVITSAWEDLEHLKTQK